MSLLCQGVYQFSRQPYIFATGPPLDMSLAIKRRANIYRDSFLAPVLCWILRWSPLELQTKVREGFRITEEF